MNIYCVSNLLTQVQHNCHAFQLLTDRKFAYYKIHVKVNSFGVGPLMVARMVKFFALNGDPMYSVNINYYYY